MKVNGRAPSTRNLDTKQRWQAHLARWYITAVDLNLGIQARIDKTRFKRKYRYYKKDCISWHLVAMAVLWIGTTRWRRNQMNCWWWWCYEWAELRRWKQNYTRADPVGYGCMHDDMEAKEDIKTLFGGISNTYCGREIISLWYITFQT